MYRRARHTHEGLWVRVAGFMPLEKWSGCRHSWASRIMTDRMPKAQEVPDMNSKSLLKRHGLLTAAERLLIEEVSSVRL